jgi:hypothetical protein
MVLVYIRLYRDGLLFGFRSGGFKALAVPSRESFLAMDRKNILWDIFMALHPVVCFSGRAGGMPEAGHHRGVCPLFGPRRSNVDFYDRTVFSGSPEAMGPIKIISSECTSAFTRVKKSGIKGSPF